MLQLINLSNASTDIEMMMPKGPEGMEDFLHSHGLDGIELLDCGGWGFPWDGNLPPRDTVKTMHLIFWPDWMDFWKNDREALLESCGSMETVYNIYGRTHDEWLEKFRRNLETVGELKVPYAVFHVANARGSEIYLRSFRYSSREVIDTALEVLNELAPYVPKGCRLLFENIFWPGLNYQEPELAARLLEGFDGEGGLLLDTGHLMNMKWSLRNEKEAVDYILDILGNLGELKKEIYEVHLHCSFSGKYAAKCQHRDYQNRKPSPSEIMDYIIKIDQHMPFKTGQCQCIFELIDPKVLVHEFIPRDLNDLAMKIDCQRKALQGI